MKGMDLFCSSLASTDICTSLDHRSDRRGTRPIDRQNSYKFCAPCSSQLPIDPRTYFEKGRKSSANKQGSKLHRKSSADHGRTCSAKQNHDLTRRKSSADISDVDSSSRYLLSDRPYIDWISEYDQSMSALVPTQHSKPRHTTSSSSKECPARKSSSSACSRREWVRKFDHSSALVATQTQKPKRISSHESPALKSSSSARSHDKVVVLRVSIHCKGCEEKVRKHISKMEGVTSFSIDLATKRVTVIGDVTPLGVLASVSKVKNAQLWPSSPSSLSLPSPSPRWST